MLTHVILSIGMNSIPNTYTRFHFCTHLYVSKGHATFVFFSPTHTPYTSHYTAICLMSTTEIYTQLHNIYTLIYIHNRVFVYYLTHSLPRVVLIQAYVIFWKWNSKAFKIYFISFFISFLRTRELSWSVVVVVVGVCTLFSYYYDCCYFSIVFFLSLFCLIILQSL